jgi:hypothetical protein
MVAANLLGRGFSYQEVARAIRYPNLSALTAALNANGVFASPNPSGARELTITLPATLHWQLQGQAWEAGYTIEGGVLSYVALSLRSGRLRNVLTPVKR